MIDVIVSDLHVIDLATSNPRVIGLTTSDSRVIDVTMQWRSPHDLLGIEPSSRDWLSNPYMIDLSDPLVTDLTTSDPCMIDSTTSDPA